MFGNYVEYGMCTSKGTTCNDAVKKRSLYPRLPLRCDGFNGISSTDLAPTSSLSAYMCSNLHMPFISERVEHKLVRSLSLMNGNRGSNYVRFTPSLKFWVDSRPQVNARLVT